MQDFYDDQATAIHAAISAKIPYFDTIYTAGKGWLVARTPGVQAEWAEAWARAANALQPAPHERCDPPLPWYSQAFVVHVGERLGRPLIRVSCPIDELQANELPPETFIVEGCVPSLLLGDAEAAKRYGGRAHTERAERADTGPREKSTIEGSPVKLVHAICDEMHAAGKFDRAAAISAAIAKGVAKNTANTQVYKWRKINEM